MVVSWLFIDSRFFSSSVYGFVFTSVFIYVPCFFFCRERILCYFHSVVHLVLLRLSRVFTHVLLYSCVSTCVFVEAKGWAVESRVYAEDPYRGFLPSIGPLVTYKEPTLKVNQGVCGCSCIVCVFVLVTLSDRTWIHDSKFVSDSIFTETRGDERKYLLSFLSQPSSSPIVY